MDKQSKAPVIYIHDYFCWFGQVPACQNRRSHNHKSYTFVVTEILRLSYDKKLGVSRDLLVNPVDKLGNPRENPGRVWSSAAITTWNTGLLLYWITEYWDRSILPEVIPTISHIPFLNTAIGPPVVQTNYYFLEGTASRFHMTIKHDSIKHDFKS